ncbi:Glu-tRNA(Gln) amidotransferase subunit GatD [Candidatus Woesearchaeota archaeon]|nr:Glu-tRNA(Gln) amidotransferase subunit GatD [Candidatus Woesearchaeota archaeon]
MQPKPGDRIKVETKDEVIEGILMPRGEYQDESIIVLKLNSGYNIGLNREDVSNIEVLRESGLAQKAERKEVKHNPKLPTISILHTGGTIASKVDYRTGAVFSSFTPEDLLEQFPELAKIANFSSELVSNMWSDDLRFKHFEVIAKAVEKEVKKGVEGIIIGMGTDNLAVAAAALAFIVEETPVPIILVGAQRSSDRGSSDAYMNLVCAAEFIAKSDFAGVAICMHEKPDDDVAALFPAAKTRKMHASRRDAFKAVNDTIIARVHYDSRKIEFVKKDYTRKDKARKIVIKPAMEEKVGLLKIHINMFPEQFSFFKGYKGLVIEGTGLGHTPGHMPNEIARIHLKIFPAIKEVIDSGCVVVMTSQTIFGRVNMHVYNKAVDLAQLGVIPGEDMLAETALVKLSWLLANYPVEEVKRLIGQNLRGEINSRITTDEFLDE